MSPFDGARFAALTKGLEAAIIRTADLERTLRLDAEFFRREHMRVADALRSHRHETVVAVADVSDGNHFTISDDFVDEGIPYYRGQDVVGNFFIEQSAPNFITEEAYNRAYMARSHLAKGDVLLSIIGTIGELSLVASDKPATCSCKLAILRPNSIRPEFLAVALRSKVGRLQIERLTRGAVQMGLILEDMDQLLVPRLTPALENRIADLIVTAKGARELAAAGQQRAEDTLAVRLGLSPTQPTEPLSYMQSAKFVTSAGRLDAQYFMPAKTEVLDALGRLPGSTLGEVFQSARDILDPQKDTGVGLVRNFDVTHALEPILDDEHDLVEFSEIGSTKKKMKNGDVAISRLRSYLKEIAIVRCSDQFPAVGSTEFIVLRPRKKECRIKPETLATFLRSQPVQTVLKWCQDGSQHPRFSEKDLLSIPLPDAVADASPLIEKLVADAMIARHQARQLTRAAMRAVEIAVSDGNAGAARYLDESGV